MNDPIAELRSLSTSLNDLTGQRCYKNTERYVEIDEAERIVRKALADARAEDLARIEGLEAERDHYREALAQQANLVFRDKTDPEANGRQPQIGEQRFTLIFPLDDGRTLKIHMGREGIAHHRKVIMDEFMDEQFEIVGGSSRTRFHDARRLRLELTPLIGLQDAEVAAEIEAILQQALEAV